MSSALADVVIAGGSHVGLALALALVRLGGPETTVTVIERGAAAPSGPAPSGPAPSSPASADPALSGPSLLGPALAGPAAAGPAAADPRAFALSAGSKALLEAIGVWPALADAAEPVRRIEITDSALDDAIRPVLLGWDNTTAGGAPASFIVEARRLGAALAARVRATPSIRLVEGREVAGLAMASDGVRLGLAGGGEAKGALAVAADGARSRLRDLAAIQSVGWGYEQTGLVATVASERPHEGRAVQHFLPGGPFALLPLTGGRCCITWSEAAAEAARIQALDDTGFLAEAQRRAGWRLGALALAGPRGAFPLVFQSARTLIGPRLALAGDAARSVHPIAGQGLNLGLRDAAALAECIVDAMHVGLPAGDAAALERYERWRRFDAFSWGAGFTALNQLFSNDIGPLRALRGVGLGIVDRLPGLKDLLVAEAAGQAGEVPRLMAG